MTEGTTEPAGAIVEAETIAQIFAEVLGLPEVGTDQDFFALGGHSLLAVWLRSRVRDECGVDLPVRAVFDAPTARQLSQVVHQLAISHEG